MKKLLTGATLAGVALLSFSGNTWSVANADSGVIKHADVTVHCDGRIKVTVGNLPDWMPEMRVQVGPETFTFTHTPSKEHENDRWSGTKETTTSGLNGQTLPVHVWDKDYNLVENQVDYIGPGSVTIPAPCPVETTTTTVVVTSTESPVESTVAPSTTTLLAEPPIVVSEPPVVTQPTVPVTTAVAPPVTLPATGSNETPWVLAGTVFLLLGFTALVAARRLES